MAEEQRFESQEQSLRLCANNCGFFGSSATMNLCSKCYRDHHLNEEQSSTAKIAVEKSLAASSSSSESDSSSSDSDSITTVDSNVSLPALILPESADEDYRTPILAVPTVVIPSPSDRPEIITSKPNRCSTCRKKVGLTGFPCRCGITFCGTHRYPEQHGCTFDFKGVGREAIAKANPVVKGQKLEKI